MDSGFTSLNNWDEKEKKDIANAGLVASRIEMKDFQNYKAILDINGNIYCWSSRFCRFCFVWILLLSRSNHVGWITSIPRTNYSPGYIHYVPANLSNLVHHDPTMQPKMQQIVKNAKMIGVVLKWRQCNCLLIWFGFWYTMWTCSNKKICIVASSPNGKRRIGGCAIG